MDVLIKLQGGQNFSSLAALYSLDRGSKDQGGDLGFFPRGVMAQPIENVAFALNPGQISGILHTDFGYHIIQVVEKDPARQVADELLAPWRQTTFSNWLSTQRTTAKIEYLIPLQ
jgi:parvulin-like peptidyl-prolyl isomerase